MNAELFAMTIEPLLQTLIRDSGLKLSYNLHINPLDTIPMVAVEFRGADVPVLLSRNAELLLAMEHIAVKALRLEPEHHDMISFDAGGFKAARERTLQRQAERAVQQVRSSGQPYHFPSMNSRERRLLHLALAPYGMDVASEGEGRLRHIVVSLPEDTASH